MASSICPPFLFSTRQKLNFALFKRMSLTYTEPLPLGFTAPEFRLMDTVSGNRVSLEEIRGEKATVVMFICNHCPYVVHVREELVNLGNEYISKGIGFVAISSNDAQNYPQDGPEKMKELALEIGMPFPYLFDEDQEVAKAYHAACTPDLAVFDQELKCVYRGQLDGSRPGNNVPVTGKDMRNALDAILSGSPIPTEQMPSVGCNIKWKA